MSKPKPKPPENLRLNPEARLANEYDAYSLKRFPAEPPLLTGPDVIDNCAEENIQ